MSHASQRTRLGDSLRSGRPSTHGAKASAVRRSCFALTLAGMAMISSACGSGPTEKSLFIPTPGSPVRLEMPAQAIGVRFLALDTALGPDSSVHLVWTAEMSDVNEEARFLHWHQRLEPGATTWTAPTLTDSSHSWFGRTVAVGENWAHGFEPFSVRHLASRAPFLTWSDDGELSPADEGPCSALDAVVVGDTCILAYAAESPRGSRRNRLVIVRLEGQRELGRDTLHLPATSAHGDQGPRLVTWRGALHLFYLAQYFENRGSPGDRIVLQSIGRMYHWASEDKGQTWRELPEVLLKSPEAQTQYHELGMIKADFCVTATKERIWLFYTTGYVLALTTEDGVRWSQRRKISDIYVDESGSGKHFAVDASSSETDVYVIWATPRDNDLRVNEVFLKHMRDRGEDLDNVLARSALPVQLAAATGTHFGVRVTAVGDQAHCVWSIRPVPVDPARHTFLLYQAVKPWAGSVDSSQGRVP